MTMATVAASVQSGRTVTPYLLEDFRPEASPDAPLTGAEGRALRGLMQAVVTEGSGSVLAGVADGAKTGTAEYGDPLPDGSLATHAWMIAYLRRPGRGGLRGDRRVRLLHRRPPPPRLPVPLTTPARRHCVYARNGAAVRSTSLRYTRKGARVGAKGARVHAKRHLSNPGATTRARRTSVTSRPYLSDVSRERKSRFAGTRAFARTRTPTSRDEASRGQGAREPRRSSCSTSSSRSLSRSRPLTARAIRWLPAKSSRCRSRNHQ